MYMPLKTSCMQTLESLMDALRQPQSWAEFFAKSHNILDMTGERRFVMLAGSLDVMSELLALSSFGWSFH